ncbi:N-acetyltransferase [Bacteroidia bacterium]|nr:N-acetyltransferase [Bacteroidia bacterium]
METTTYKLREWQLSDAASLAENANNIRVWNNLRDYFPHPYSENDGIQFIQMISAKPKPATDMAIVVDGKAVGGIGIIPRTDVERVSAELGYWLGEKYWNRGIMTQVVKEMVSYTFLNFPLQKIYATPFGFSIASQKVLEKAGFEREAILKKAAIKNGKIVDEYYYSFFRTQWIANVHHRF